MADQKITQLTQVTSLSDSDLFVVSINVGTAPVTRAIKKSDAIPTSTGGGAKYPCDGRLTLETGVPVSTTDQANKTTLYFTPYAGNQVGLYDGSSAWTTLSFAELSLNITAFTASKPYDIWIYNNAGTAALDSTVWTSTTARATALALQDGVLVKSGATTRRYLGTIYMDSASKCQDTFKLRYVWNYYNRVTKPMYSLEATASWSYTTTAWRYQNNSSSNRLEMIVGVSESPIKIFFYETAYNSSSVLSAWGGIGEDTSTSYSGTAAYVSSGTANADCTVMAVLIKTPAVGFHYYAAIEYGAANTVFRGKHATAAIKSPILGEVPC